VDETRHWIREPQGTHLTPKGWQNSTHGLSHGYREDDASVLAILIMKTLTTTLRFFLVSIMIISAAFAQEKPEAKKVAAKPKHSTKVIMKLAMKDGLVKTVAEGKATDKQRLELPDGKQADHG
jgi:hypothetical protein